MDHEIWRAEPDGQLSAEILNLKLIVLKSDTGARYMILQRNRDGRMNPEVMLSSGTEPNVEAAIVAATRVAARIDLMLAERRRTVMHVQRGIHLIEGANG